MPSRRSAPAPRALGLALGLLPILPGLGCGASSPLDGWSTAALCKADGSTSAPPDVIPAPRAYHETGILPLPSLRLHAEGAPDVLPAGALRRLGLDLGLTASELPLAGDGMSVSIHGPAVLEEALARCAVPPPPGDEAYFLASRARPGGGLEVLVAAASRRGASRAIALLEQLVTRAPAGGPGLREVSVADAPALALRGVLEGFYGPAWFPEERLEMLRFTWRMRMNVLVWAPKSEFGSRIFWRGEYPSEVREHLASLFAEAAELDLEVCAEISPGNGILYSDSSERALLLQKLESLWSLGATCLAIAFDDIPRELRPEDRARYPGGLGEAQGDLIAEVFGALARAHPGARLGFVPTDYSTTAAEEHPDYVAAIAANLPAGVFLGWTGPEIVSARVTEGDVAHATALWGRPLLMGDNYPVNDGAREVGGLQLGPVVGREAAALLATGGWVANTMALPRASLIPVATIADQLWRPEPYTPEEAWSRAIARVALGDRPHEAWADEAAAARARRALELLARTSRGSALDPREAIELEAAAEAWLARFPEEHPELRGLLEELAGIEAELEAEGALAPGRSTGPLGRELAPWARELSAYGRAGLLAMDLAAETRGGRADPVRVARLRADAERLAASPVVVAGDVLDHLLAEALTRLAR